MRRGKGDLRSFAKVCSVNEDPQRGSLVYDSRALTTIGWKPHYNWQ